MKTDKIIAVLLCFWLSGRGVVAAQNPGGEQEFTIRGEIAGLAVGDTLRFERIVLPGWALEHAFDVPVTSPGSFEHTELLPHTQYYMMTYLPRTGQPPRSALRGLTMIAGGGTVTVSGNVDEIYFSRVDGEAFGEEPLLREAKELENSLLRERSRYLRLADEAFASLDSVKGREYIKMFNEFRREEDSKRAAELTREFLDSRPSSVWSVVNRLERAFDAPIDSLEVWYARLDAPARESYYGTVLRETIDGRVRLQPGKPAPGFSVTLPDGGVMNSEQFRGKYLLIYHWGFCPGSIQLEGEATDLYNRFSEHLEVLGITESLQAIRDAAQGTPPDEELFGITLKPVYESMAVHRWIDIESGTGENSRIGELYAFAGFPFFVLISPDGKIVSRGFYETFYETQTVLEEQYD